MDLIYGEDLFFIGAIKFFDTKKDFGYIASNNCGMPVTEYKQDFYVKTSSFVDKTAISEGRIVVFQVGKQKDERLLAVNVRSIQHTDDDHNLALTYYGDHEKIEFKDKKVVNLFNSIHVPRKKNAEFVAQLIEKDESRSPQKSLVHFKFFIGHYKVDTSDYSKRYIFDRDFDREEKKLWVNLFSIFTEDEAVEILKNYPTACQYLNKQEILVKWLKELTYTEFDLARLKELNIAVGFLPEDLRNEAQDHVVKCAESLFKIELEKMGKESEYEQHFFRMRIRPYLKLTTINHEKDIENCVESIKYNFFKKKIDSFVSNPLSSSIKRQFFSAYDDLKIEKDKHHEEFQNAVCKVLDKLIDDKHYADAIDLLNDLDNKKENFHHYYKSHLLPIVKSLVCEKIKDRVDNGYNIYDSFYDEYKRLTQIYNNQEKNEIIDSIYQIILQTDSLHILSSSVKYWFPFERVQKRVSEIISNWKFLELKHFLENCNVLFENQFAFYDIIVDKAISLIGNYRLKDSFTGETSLNNNYSCEENVQIDYNCNFLRKLSKYISFSHSNAQWDNYIQSRSVDELLILYQNNVISDIPSSKISEIINSISLESTVIESGRWYDKPTFKDQTYVDILTGTSVDLFPIICKRLNAMEFNSETMPLAALLIEMMALNKPGDGDYNDKRKWENDFSVKLENLKKSQPGNEKLSVLLWVIYGKTKSSIAGLKDSFTLLPPYLQIRSVKKLFSLIAQGKLKKTAKELYDLVRIDSNTHICLPLEIAFTYLIRREENPSDTLDNKVMLLLLNGREDHSEWIGIRQLVTPCFGRWQAKDLPDDSTNENRWRFYNGIITDANNDQFELFVPKRLIDGQGQIKPYNNKFFEQIKELIGITFSEDEYYVKSNPNGFYYYFQKSNEIELYSIARSFNLKFKNLNNYLGFNLNDEQDDVFCECRLSDKLDNYHGISFYWCGNRPCFRPPIRFMLESEWEQYTMLDFMRILHIPTSYTTQNGNTAKFGHYIILSSFLKSFVKFYEHLKCRECGNLMKPVGGITNFTTHAINEFKCVDENCQGHNNIVYLNHCFNKKNCKAIIDSRDSKTCSNKQYICPECGACCSTENFKNRLDNLRVTGGRISSWLVDFVKNDLGHWEKHEFFCYKCGKLMTNENGIYSCKDCEIEYNHQ